MIEIISIKFKNRGKSYFFDPRGLSCRSGDKVVVETARGLELADCTLGNHSVEDSAVVQPLRPVVRLATADDLRVEEINKRREQEAFGICLQKIAQHGLDMKLVDVECSFEGNKITFFFTSDGRVDFRELVKDLASVFRSRIELRQIGVRDEAKMIGGIALCGRPYCCSQFLEDFQPVSTKMAKVQGLPLNPTKISGSCGRLMCCLRYEQEAYEDLNRSLPRQGAFVETIDGYGTVVQVNLLRQTAKVRLDGEGNEELRLYKARELAAVPGGRPKEGVEPPHVLEYVPEPEEEIEEEKDDWTLPVLYAEDREEVSAAESAQGEKKGRRRRRGKSKAQPQPEAPAAEKPPKSKKPVARAETGKKPETAEKNKDGQGKKAGKATVKPVRVEPKPQTETAEKPKKSRRPYRYGRKKKSGDAQAPKNQSNAE